MAGDWLPIRLDLWDDPRIVRLARALDCGRAAAVGACVRLWATADNYSADGSLNGYDVATIDALVGIDGFAMALASVGWLTIESDRVIVPDFEKWCSRGAKRRLSDNRRKADARKLSASRAEKKRTKSGPQDCGQKSGPQNRTEQERTGHSEVVDSFSEHGGMQGGNAADDWAAVVSEVFDVGVNDAAAAVHEAQLRGATLADVRELVTFWAEAPERWDYPEQALYRRLMRWQRGQAVAEGWERPSAEYDRAQRNASAMARRRDEAQRVASQHERSDVERAKCQAEYRRLVESQGSLAEQLAARLRETKR